MRRFITIVLLTIFASSLLSAVPVTWIERPVVAVSTESDEYVHSVCASVVVSSPAWLRGPLRLRLY